jgi:hypothetical protein
MTYSTDALSNRTMSSFPISIGTSFILEAMFTGPNPTYDPERVSPAKVDLNKYTEVWINLFTIFRNIISAMDKEGFNKVMPADLASVLEFEIDLIKRAIEEHTFNRVKVIYYACDYAGLEKEFPHARVRVDSTERQKIYTTLLTNTINTFFRSQAKVDYFKHFKLRLTPIGRPKALIITHYAFDLLSWKHFETLDLLESHTAVVKTRAVWNSKYMEGKSLVRIPFSEMFMQVFGDANTFYPNDRKLREEIISIAEKNNWNSFTTKDRILLGITQISNPYHISILKEMM